MDFKISSALVSVYYKNGLEPLAQYFKDNHITVYSTGGTLAFFKQMGIDVIAVEDITHFPEILDGRVKTLHPAVFGGILHKRNDKKHLSEIAKHHIPSIDLVIVDLYPFEETLQSEASHDDIIEKIDIGGISLIRAAAKNYEFTTIISQKQDYELLYETLVSQNGHTTLEQRKHWAGVAFKTSSEYDTLIGNYLNNQTKEILRYGENPHQKATFNGNLNLIFDQLHGKTLSYNNILDVDSAVNLIDDFDDSTPAFAIIKHNNACGFARAKTLKQSYEMALAADPVSAFGGVLCANVNIDESTAELIDQLFFEILIAPQFSEKALEILKSKKNRIILQKKSKINQSTQVRSVLNGTLVQDKDLKIVNRADLNCVSDRKPSESEIEDALFANILVKHTKSNAIILAKHGQLLASGTGQTSRVDALEQSIAKAKKFGFDLNGACMASDAFFPFPDCVEIAKQAGIEIVIQPGGSIKDQLSIDYCNQNNMAMLMTGIRHFKH